MSLHEVLVRNTRIVVHDAASGMYGRVPEVRPVIDYIYKNEDADGLENPISYIAETGLNYLRVVRSMAHITDADIKLLRQADALKKERGLVHNSASHVTAADFLTILGPEVRRSLTRMIGMGFTSGTPNNSRSIVDLVNRMAAGHQFRVEHPHEKPTDADPATRTLIYGHTDPNWDIANHPRELIHFTISHECDRIFQAHFSNDPDDEIRGLAGMKDVFIDAMSAIIRLRRAQGITFGDVSDMYQEPRNHGGVGWGSPERQKVYDDIVHANAQ